MGEAGLFGEDARVELLDGEVVTMSPIGARHAACVKRLNKRLIQLVGERAVVSVQDPVHLDGHSEPQPDLSLARPPLERYLADHAGPQDLLLLIEVSDSTFSWDRGHKAALYARAGVPETWVVDLAGERVVVLTDPAPGGYATERVGTRGDTVEPRALAGIALGVDEILG